MLVAKQFIFGTLLLVLVNVIAAEYDVDGVCTLVSNGVRIGSIESCLKYYICNNGKATAYTCPSGSKFSKNSQTCLTAANVNCYFGETTPCTGKNGVFVPKTGSCNGWIYCKNGQEISNGTCSNNLIFRDGECIYGDCANSVNTLDASFTSICQVLPNNKYFGSTMDCTKWQICRNEKLSGGVCKGDLVYEVASATCSYKTASTCAHVTGVKVQPDVEVFGSCTENGALKSTGICSDYLKCTNGLWTRQSCTNNFFFDTVKQTCVTRKAAVTTDCDRCQFTKNTFANAVDVECRKYLICSNGVQKSSNSCGSAYYFDESSQACMKISGTVDLAAVSGACYTAPTSGAGDSDTSGDTSGSNSSDAASGDTSDSGSSDAASGDTSDSGSSDAASGDTSGSGSSDSASGDTSDSGSSDAASGDARGSSDETASNANTEA
ncbi:peritrophin-48-like [Rhagoletis pomonella]|uniref:peritrophin-48-like n=1 Tax=Rhagoletis pomonella TaxID=28610 RepID=UPI00177B5DE3|nr:peritrophin-48-like [Rhagoletis pomonella]XP_036326254.1 peritrophin-48-like [Rhagoletis pomonella]